MSAESEGARTWGIATGIFRGYFIKRRDKYEKLRDKLLRARIFMPVERWLSQAIVYSLIAAGIAVSVYILLRYLILSLLAEFTLSEFDLGVSLMLALIAFLGTYVGFLYYPSIKAWERKGKIDMNLPYAISYISAMASIGVYPFSIFKKLAGAEETYGEVSRELKLLVRDVELLGFDFITALKKLVATTPSSNMRAFLQGAVTTTLSGGDMGSYFVNTAQEYMEERRKHYQDFIQTLELFAEFYVIGVVAAPLLLVVVLSVLVFLGGASIEGLSAIIYLVIPLGSAGFIFLVGTVSSE
ncbi:MAG: type II secretion system F family protein [Methanomicrobia archaeon]|nr:type II secretion system F family protein [Methanomicrobia archaeon]